MQAFLFLIIAITFGVCSIFGPAGDPAGPFLGLMAVVVALAACFSLKTGDES